MLQPEFSPADDKAATGGGGGGGDAAVAAGGDDVKAGGKASAVAASEPPAPHLHRRSSRFGQLVAQGSRFSFSHARVVDPEEAARRSRLLAEVQETRRRLRRASTHVVSPNDRAVRRWDLVTFAALIFTAVVTPVEVAFLGARGIDSLWVMNRMIDGVFCCDIVLQFFIGYKDPTRGNVFICDRVLIAKRYLRSWFLVDCVSTFPFEVVAYVPGCGVLARFRAIRLLKLLKLGRMGRVARMLERWEVYAVFAVSYAQLSMYKSTVLLVVWAHWTACLWGLVASPAYVGRGTWTWLRAYELRMTDPRDGRLGVPDPDGRGGRHFRPGSARMAYLASLYMAIYTMTGIGYGDITPTNEAELGLLVAIMILSAVFWAFMIGNFCSLVATLNVHESVFRARMDNLNSMMEDRKFPADLRQRCRMFLLNSKQHQRASTYAEIETYFSVSLRGEVAASSNQAWIRKVWYLRRCSKEFIIELSQSLETMMFAPMEPINVPFALFILQAGIAARKGRILSKGSVWGADFVIRETDLIDRTCAASLSYTVVLAVEREPLLEILENDDFDAEYAQIVRAANFYSFRALMIRLGRELLARRRAGGGAGGAAPARPSPPRAAAAAGAPPLAAALRAEDSDALAAAVDDLCAAPGPCDDDVGDDERSPTSSPSPNVSKRSMLGSMSARPAFGAYKPRPGPRRRSSLFRAARDLGGIISASPPKPDGGDETAEPLPSRRRLTPLRPSLDGRPDPAAAGSGGGGGGGGAAARSPASPDLERRVAMLAEVVDDLATDFLPKAFARLERHVDRDRAHRATAPDGRAHRAHRPSHVAGGGGDDFAQQAVALAAARRRSPRTEIAGIL